MCCGLGLLWGPRHEPGGVRDQHGFLASQLLDWELSAADLPVHHRCRLLAGLHEWQMRICLPTKLADREHAPRQRAPKISAGSQLDAEGCAAA
jgi:hypothetical protein